MSLLPKIEGRISVNSTASTRFVQNSELNYWLTFKNLNGIDHSTQEVELGFELVWQEVEFTDSSLLILRNIFKP